MNRFLMIAPRLPRIALRVAMLALAVLLHSSSIGCTRKTDLMATYLRFIESDPQEILDEESLLQTEQIFEWRPGAGERCLEIWPSDRAQAEIHLGPHAARLRWESDRMNLFVDADLDTKRTDRIEIYVKSLDPRSSRTGRLILMWSDSDEKFSLDRSAKDLDGEMVTADIRKYRFAPGVHRSSFLSASRLRLVTIPTPGAKVALCSIIGYSESPRPDRLAELVESGFKVALGGQIRNALPGIPHLPLERDLVVPRGAELRFAYGLLPGVRIPVTFRVTALADGKPKPAELFKVSLSPTESGSPWREGKVKLASLAEEQITLRLETSATGDIFRKRGFPVWGHPEVVAPGH